MKIVVDFDSSVSSAPAGFKSAIDYVANLYDKLFTNNVTVTIDVGWGEVNGKALPGDALGASDSNFTSGFTYAQVRNALIGGAQSPIQSQAYSSLPSTDPTGGASFNINTAEAKALGLSTSSGVDGEIGFDSNVGWSFTPGATPAAGADDLVAVAEHEISEVMGRGDDLGTTLSPMDLFRYSSNGVRDLTSVPPSPYTGAYFSIDGGATDLDNWNPVAAKGDLGDWALNAGDDAYDYAAGKGTHYFLTTTGVELMNVLGWTTTSTPTRVTSAVTALSQTVSSGVTESLLSGGGAVSGTVLSGGEQYLQSGASASQTTVSSGGHVVDYGSTLSISLAGGYEGVAASATASVTMVSNGGVLHLDAAASGYDSIISSGGLEVVYANALESGGTVSGGLLELYGVASSVYVGASGVEIVESGGQDNFTTVDGTQSVLVSAFAASAIVYGKQIDDGFTQRTTLQGGYESVAAGAAAGTTVVDSGGTLHIDSGGEGIETSVLYGGSETVYQGGLEALGAIEVGGKQTVFGSAQNMSVGAEQFVSSGGVEVNDVITLGGAVTVYAGGSGVTGAVSSGGSETVFGQISLTIVEHGGALTLGSGGDDGDASVYGVESVTPGALASGATIFSGGDQIVGGSASGTVLSGGEQDIGPAGSETGTLVLAGGKLVVESGEAIADTVVGSGGLEVIDAGAEDPGATVVETSGVQQVYGSSLRTLLSGGAMSVFSGGRAVSAVVDDGSAIGISSGAVASRTIVEAGGVDNVAGSVISTTLSGVGAEEFVGAGGTAVRTIIEAEGRQYVASGALTSDTLVEADGVAVVSAGGSAVRETIDGGEYLYGSSLDATISAGGIEYVEAGAIARNAVISGGGEQLVSSGGAASDTAVASGGALVDDGQVTLSAGAFAGTLSGSGTLAKIGAGTLTLAGVASAFSGHLLIDAGVVELAAAGGVGASPVFFESTAASATLTIDAADAPAPGAVFASPLEDFDQTQDAIDLTSVKFVSGATAVASGSSLVLTDGGHSYHFKLGGTSETTFKVVQDAGSGTLVTPATDTQVSPHTLSQAMAGFGSTGGSSVGFHLPGSPAHSDYAHVDAGRLGGSLACRTAAA